jgi:hypothetical protein
VGFDVKAGIAAVTICVMKGREAFSNGIHAAMEYLLCMGMGKA